MKFVLYNIRYGTGSGWTFHLPFPFSGYLRPTSDNLRQIIEFLRVERPDIIGLIEVDNGSYRSQKSNQAETIATELGLSHVYQSKYPHSSFAQHLPIMREQGNAFITNQNIMAKGFHYFDKGIKRLVIELEFESFVIFLVHLSLKFRHRQHQLGDLYSMFAEVSKPMIVAGDFNALWGDRELHLFLAATGLANSNKAGIPTHPSWAPRRQLDFVLHSPEIAVRDLRIPRVPYSDHMPLVCDFEIAG